MWKNCQTGSFPPPPPPGFLKGKMGKHRKTSLQPPPIEIPREKKHLAILLVTFLGWLNDPFKGCWWPPTFGRLKGQGLNHLGDHVLSIQILVSPSKSWFPQGVSPKGPSIFQSIPRSINTTTSHQIFQLWDRHGRSTTAPFLITLENKTYRCAICCGCPPVANFN